MHEQSIKSVKTTAHSSRVAALWALAAVRCQRFVTPFLPIRSEQGALAGAA